MTLENSLVAKSTILKVFGKFLWLFVNKEKLEFEIVHAFFDNSKGLKTVERKRRPDPSQD